MRLFATLLTVFVTYMIILFSLAKASYEFKIFVIDYQNPTHQKEDGGCCEIQDCTNPCDNAFIISVSEANNSDDGDEDNNMVIFKTDLIKNDDDNLSFNFENGTIGNLNNPILVSGDVWPVEVKITIVVFDLDGTSYVDDVSDIVANFMINISSKSMSDINTYSSGYSTLQLAYNLTCIPPHYGLDCSTQCWNNTGHYMCDPVTGDKICLEGYQNPLTDCTEYTHSSQSSANIPIKTPLIISSLEQTTIPGNNLVLIISTVSIPVILILMITITVVVIVLVCIHKRRNRRDRNEYDIPSTDHIMTCNHAIEQVKMKAIEKCHDDHIIYETINPPDTDNIAPETEPTYNSAVDALYEIIQDDLMRLHANVAYGTCIRTNRNVAYGVANNTHSD